MPSDTGQPGGRRTGQKMTHYILDCGRFQMEADKLINSGFKLNWQSRSMDARQKPPQKSKVKYSCPDCGQNAWGKPDTKLICGECEQPMESEDTSSSHNAAALVAVNISSGGAVIGRPSSGQELLTCSQKLQCTPTEWRSKMIPYKFTPEQLCIERGEDKIYTSEDKLTGDCSRCRYKKAVMNRTYRGPKIPGGAGKCVRAGGICPGRADWMAQKAMETDEYRSLVKSMPNSNNFKKD